MSDETDPGVHMTEHEPVSAIDKLGGRVVLIAVAAGSAFAGGVVGPAAVTYTGGDPGSAAVAAHAATEGHPSMMRRAERMERMIEGLGDRIDDHEKGEDERMDRIESVLLRLCLHSGVDCSTK